MIGSHFWENRFDPEKGCFETPRIKENYGNPNEHGYMYVGLKRKGSGERQLMRVHRAVWMAYHKKEIPKNMQIMHLNHALMQIYF